MEKKDLSCDKTVLRQPVRQHAPYFGLLNHVEAVSFL